MSDDAMVEILRRVQKQLSCPACQRKFRLEELKVRGVFDRQYLIQASCSTKHPPALVLFVASGKQLKQNDQGLTADDVIDLHKSLKNFDGDFKTAFQAIDKN